MTAAEGKRRRCLLFPFISRFLILLKRLLTDLSHPFSYAFPTRVFQNISASMLVHFVFL